jgi:hypothetical protein
MAFIAAVSIRSYFRTKTFTDFNSTRLERREIEAWFLRMWLSVLLVLKPLVK